MELGLTRGRDESSDYSLITQEKCNAPRTKLFLVSIVSFIVALLVILIVVLTRIEQKEGHGLTDDCWLDGVCNITTNPDSDDGQCAEVAVVGGGLAGCYALWRLLQNNSTRKVVLFEMSSQIGGRFHTLHPPNISQGNLEAAAMYYIPAIHPLMNSLVEKLDLQLSPLLRDFVVDDVLYRLRGVSLRARQLNTTHVPFNMDDSERLYPYDLLRKYLSVNSPDNSSDANIQKAELSNSLKRVLLERASHEAYKYLEDTLDQRDFDGDAQARLVLDSALHTGLHTALDNINDRFTIFGGMDILPRKLAFESLLKGGSYNIRHKLVSLQESDSSYVMEYDVTGGTSDTVVRRQVCSKAVILALPPPAIKQLSVTSLDSWIDNQLDAVLGVKSMTLLLIYDTPWWRDAQLHMTWRVALTDLPIGDVMETSSIDDGEEDVSVLMVTVSKDDNIDFWRSLLDEDQRHVTWPRPSDVLIRHLTSLIRSLASGNVSIPQPTTVVIKLWDSRVTYTDAAYMWRPHVDWYQVSSSALQPVSTAGIHIVGSAFAPGHLQLWAEGALYTVDQLMATVPSLHT